jgi:hypothetical protein
MGHVSPDTAHVTEDYPYSFHLRCQRREWLEYRPKFGYRLCTQTTNPKKGDRWNAPKYSTYSYLAVMYLDEQGHVQQATLHLYRSVAEVEAFERDYGAALDPVRELPLLRAMLSYARAQEAKRASQA